MFFKSIYPRSNFILRCLFHVISPEPSDSCPEFQIMNSTRSIRLFRCIYVPYFYLLIVQLLKYETKTHKDRWPRPFFVGKQYCHYLSNFLRINVAFMRHNVFIHVLCLLLILRRLKRSNLIETRTPNCIFIVFTHSFLMVRGFEIFNCSTCVGIFAPLSIVSELRVTL